MPKADSPPATPGCNEPIVVSKIAIHSRHDLHNVLESARQRFVKRNPQSERLFEQACENLPGGNTRTLLYSAPFPVSMRSGKGYQVTDEDGHVYTDFVGELTAALYGHSHPLIQTTLIHAITNVGLNLGSTIAQENVHAKSICKRFNLDKVRFTNSGTEANLHALAGARHFTGRRRVVVFSGGYHGGVFSFWDGVQVNGVDKHEWLVSKYNDVEAARHLIENEEDIAAVLVEGMQGAGGCVPGSRAFLHQLQESARKVGAVFILDEVMTSRLAPGGIQSILGVSPDLTSFGKYLGGGMTFGAFGGRADIMAVYDPRTPNSLSHSGTFNNNTLAMYAGQVGLDQIYTPETAIEFNAMGDRFRQSLETSAKGTKMSVSGRGSLIGVHFSQAGTTKITCREDIEEDMPLKELFYIEMMEEGFWVTKRGSISLMLPTPESELERFVDGVVKFLDRHRDLVAL